MAEVFLFGNGTRLVNSLKKYNMEISLDKLEEQHSYKQYR